MSNEISFALYNVTFYPTKTLFPFDAAQLCNENSENNPNNSRIIINPTFVYYTSIIRLKKQFTQTRTLLIYHYEKREKKEKDFLVYTLQLCGSIM